MGTRTSPRNSGTHRPRPLRYNPAFLHIAFEIWQELHTNKRLLQTYSRAENGNVALTGEIDLQVSAEAFVLAVGFGPTAMEAGQHALISLLEDFDATQAEYVRAWKAWHARLIGGVPPEARTPLYHISAAVLRTHESKRVEGGIIASLSIPWGSSTPDEDLGGYPLAWPRSLVEIAGGLRQTDGKARTIWSVSNDWHRSLSASRNSVVSATRVVGDRTRRRRPAEQRNAKCSN